MASVSVNSSCKNSSAVTSRRKFTTSRMSNVRVMRDAAGIAHEPKGTADTNKKTPMPKLTEAPKEFFNYWWLKLMTAGTDGHRTNSPKLCEEFDELEMQFTRSRPPSISDLQKRHPEFNKEEIKTLYQAFKQSCTNGVLTERILEEIFGQIFQIGDSNEFAQLVFATLDLDNDGEVVFEEFLDGLAILTKRSEECKLQWIFKLYDIDQDGILSNEELLVVLNSMYNMSSASKGILTSNRVIYAHLESILTKFIYDSTAALDSQCYELDFERFKHVCCQDQSIMEQISALTNNG